MGRMERGEEGSYLAMQFHHYLRLESMEDAGDPCTYTLPVKDSSILSCERWFIAD